MCSTADACRPDQGAQRHAGTTALLREWRQRRAEEDAESDRSAERARAWSLLAYPNAGTRPCHAPADFGLVFLAAGGHNRDAVAQGVLDAAVSAVGDEHIGER